MKEEEERRAEGKINFVVIRYLSGGGKKMAKLKDKDQGKKPKDEKDKQKDKKGSSDSIKVDEEEKDQIND